jgi:hypothetical protein
MSFRDIARELPVDRKKTLSKVVKDHQQQRSEQA